MARTAKLGLVLTLALVFVALGARSARAADTYGFPDGYVCKVWESWQPNGLGANGFVAATLFSQPGCAGSLRAMVHFASMGATDCPAWTTMSESRLAGVLRSLTHALEAGLHVSVSVLSMQSGYNCAAAVTYSK
jgi:hypothetical protein